MDKLKLVELKDALQAKVLKIIIPSAILSLLLIILCVYCLMEELANPNYIVGIMVLSIPVVIGFTMYKVNGEIRKADLYCKSCKALFELETIDTILDSNICSKCNKQAFDI